MAATTAPLGRQVERAFPDRPFTIELWDGSRVHATRPGPTLAVRSPRAIGHLLRAPGELGLGRAYVCGDIDTDDLDGVVALLGRWHAPALPLRRRAALIVAALRAARFRRPPTPPAAELRPRGRLHTRRRDAAAVRHHYDVSNEFFSLFLDQSMTYSCALFEEGTETLEDAQRAKLELICRKLDLQPGQRLLDVGCGWGSMAIHAAREHGVSVVGVTLSAEQAAYARKRVADEGLTDRVEIRVQDYRDVADGPYDAISSIGMAEHVGAERYLEYARDLYGLLKPGGRLLNHQIARRPQRDESAYHVDEFIDAYVFPDGELAPVGTTVTQLERAGFEVRDVESLREHYALTLRRWVANLEADWARAVRLAGAGRA